ncbi:class I SAM-dependent methyltransferase [Mycolicibacterium helvum]|uniref:class I SAM-dependent methyltransferase n=1 Tax=Mycolicibacterium helvum TaxID=1534349 RepID=UPI003899435D
MVEIGTGLNTRFERTDNGQVRWFDLDLPDTIELRQGFFTQTDRQTMIAGSALDTDWFDTVNAGPSPHLFVAEAVFAYFTETQVHDIVTNLTERFPGSLIAFDTYGAKITVTDYPDRPALNRYMRLGRRDRPGDVADPWNRRARS